MAIFLAANKIGHRPRFPAAREQHEEPFTQWQAQARRHQDEPNIHDLTEAPEPAPAAKARTSARPAPGFEDMADDIPLDSARESIQSMCKTR